MTYNTTMIRSTLSYYAATWLCRLLRAFRPSPPDRPDYSASYTSPQFDVEVQGDCGDGTYIAIYRPANPYLGDNGKPKAVIFLHGFALGASQIYRAHLEHLAKQGYYVFYPNFQTGFCAFPSTPWQTFGALAKEVVGDGLINSQEKWLKAALASVGTAFTAVGFTADKALDTYVYGHSLGGLFALSWPYYVKQCGYPANMLPRQVLAADPIPTTAGAGIPGPYGNLLRKLTSDIDIGVTGQALTMPVAILHGNDDWVVPKEQWQVPFASIATAQKTMFLSLTDTHGCPGLFTNHEQATTDTSFFPPWLAEAALDGVGTEDNLDWRYIWYALDQVIRCGTRADRIAFDLQHWSDGRPVRPIQVFLSGKG